MNIGAAICFSLAAFDLIFAAQTTSVVMLSAASICFICGCIALEF